MSTTRKAQAERHHTRKRMSCGTSQRCSKDSCGAHAFGQTNERWCQQIALPPVTNAFSDGITEIRILRRILSSTAPLPATETMVLNTYRSILLPVITSIIIITAFNALTKTFGPPIPTEARVRSPDASGSSLGSGRRCICSTRQAVP
ncbi:hypothetical protein EJ06DRAFT_154435 [Trichodelitschia bisporula]|uniref:Uncharacterized protein n=1 Tax=Trichodelitschia bisporula TaxID=703511 RepID=A0A6G1HNR0_9PEZI|nr:hypothetical protein EJ06DRAFT_154435 [Trichodelitschia bisporula]